MDQLLNFLSQPMGVAVGGGFAVLISYVVMLLGNRIEERRKAASKVADHLNKIGLELVPEILRDYSVGDLSGALRGIIDLNRQLDDTSKRMPLLEKVFKCIVTDLLRDPDQRPRVEKFFADSLASTKPDRASEFLQAANVVLNQKGILEDVASRSDGLSALLKLAGNQFPFPLAPAASVAAPLVTAPAA